MEIYQLLILRFSWRPLALAELVGGGVEIHDDWLDGTRKEQRVDGSPK